MILGILSGGYPRERYGIWNPALMVAPPKLWLDDSSPVVEVSGACSRWDDNSGNQWHFGQNTSSRRPQIVPSVIAGRRIIRFNGSNTFLSNTSSGLLDIVRAVPSAWVFSVAKANGDSSDVRRLIFAASTNDSAWRFHLSVSEGAASITRNRRGIGGRRLNADPWQYLPSSGTYEDQWVMTLGIIDYANARAELWINGGLDGTLSPFQTAGNSSNTASIRVHVGAHTDSSSVPTGIFSGDMAALLVGSANIPSTDEIDKLFGWASWRYGLEALLPIGHPFRDSPP